MSASDEIVGQVVGVRDYGTLVILYLDDDGRMVPILFEHRAFQWLLDREQCAPKDLAGRRVSYDGTRLHFLD
jgi:hypothetical protein